MLNNNFNHFLIAFDIHPKPKLVISLNNSPASFCTTQFFNVHYQNNQHGFGNHYFIAEENKEACHNSDRNLCIFLRKCVLPVAIQTNALVMTFGGTQCSLAKAWSDICVSESSKNNGKLPFTVLSFSNAHAKPTGEHTIAGQLSSLSKRWKEAKPTIEAAISKSFGQNRFHGPQGDNWVGDLPAGCSHYIVAAAVTKGHIDGSAEAAFKNALSQRLTEEIPSIAFSTLGAGGRPANLSKLADYVLRGLPVVLLDSRPKPEGGYPATIREAAVYMESLNQKLADSEMKTMNLVRIYCCTYRPNNRSQTVSEYS